MPLVDARYTTRLPLPDLIVRGRNHTIQCPVYRDGAVVAVTEAGSTVSVYDESNTAIVDAAAVTVTSSIARYVITAATTTSLALSERWRVEWTLVLAAALAPDAVIQARNSASLVRHGLEPVIGDVDLWRVVPALDPTGTAPITPRSTYQTVIDEAWTAIQLRIIAAGNRPNLILEPSALREVHLAESLALLFGDLAARSPTYETRAAEYRLQAKEAWGRVNLLYDSSDAGQADSGRRAMSPVISLCGRG